MPKIKAILLVPSEGDPHGLLREGPCGARPPMAVEGSESWSACPWYPECGAIRASLVLAWDGKPVREGCDRADWTGVESPEPHHSVRDTWATVFPLMDHPEDTDITVDDLRRLCAELGTIVLLDADGKEIPCPT